MRFEFVEVNLRVQKEIVNLNTDPCDTVEHLIKLRLRSIIRLVIGDRNINSLPNKFEQLKLTIRK